MEVSKDSLCGMFLLLRTRQGWLYLPLLGWRDFSPQGGLPAFPSPGALNTLAAISWMCSQARCTWANSTVREQMAKRSTNWSLREQGTKWIFLALFMLSRRASFSLLEPCRLRKAALRSLEAQTCITTRGRCWVMQSPVSGRTTPPQAFHLQSKNSTK